NNTNIDIDNSGACAEVVYIDTNGDGKPDKKVTKKPGQVLGSSSSKLPQGGVGGAGGSGGAAGGKVLGMTSGGSGGSAGSSIHYPSTSGGAGGSGGNGDHNGGGGDNFVIDTTGPD